MCLLDQSGVTGGWLDPYNVHALFVNIMYNTWTERFGYQALLVISLRNETLLTLFIGALLYLPGAITGGKYGTYLFFCPIKTVPANKSEQNKMKHNLMTSYSIVQKTHV